jgi:hypothetical protein
VLLNGLSGSVANAIFFYLYQDGKKRYGFEEGEPSFWKTLAISLRASLCSMVLTTPLWTTKTRLVLFQEEDQRMRSHRIIRRVVADMWEQGGVRTFYRGFVPSIFMSGYGFIQMYTYEMLTFIFGFQTGQIKSMSKDNFLLPFLCGGVARSIASCALLPVNVVRMRLQMRTYSKAEIEERHVRVTETNRRQEVEYRGMRDAIIKIYRNEGVRAFYKGLTPTVVKIFPQSGLFFLSYEMTLGCLSHL